MTGRRLIELVSVAGTITILDQVAKWLIQRSFHLGEVRPLIDGLLALSYVRNPGVAFGLFSDAALVWRMPFFVVVAAAAAWLLGRIYRSSGHLLLGRLSVSLIVGGAAGNFVDRIRFGEVVDFIDVIIWRYHFPTFNVADSAISVGVGMLLFALWKAKEL